MLHFKCKDIGMQCPFETDAHSKEYMMQKIAKHAKNMHNIREISPDLQKKIEKAITGH